MKFKVGDKVRIIKNVVGDKEVEKLIGEIYKIGGYKYFRNELYYRLEDEDKFYWKEKQLELVEGSKMDIKEVCKEENVGKKFKDNFGEVWEVTIGGESHFDLKSAEHGEFIGDEIYLSEILELEFEEVQQYKQITGKEALKIMLDGGLVYTSKQLVNTYAITEDKLKFKVGEEGYEASSISINFLLSRNWYIKQ